MLRYQNLTKQLDEADMNKIYELTGCLSTCDKYEYSVLPDNQLNKFKYNQSNLKEPNAMALKFYFLTGRHEVKEQVVTVE